MSLARIIRNSKIVNHKFTILAARGGHGWDRPDVPLSIHPSYEHKREVKFSTFSNSPDQSL
jgi:hypothetical protein